MAGPGRFSMGTPFFFSSRAAKSCCPRPIVYSPRATHSASWRSSLVKHQSLRHQLLDVFLAERWVPVEQGHHAQAGASPARIVHSDLALPFCVEQIPEGVEVAGGGLRRVVNERHVHAAGEDQIVLPGAVGEVVLAAQPFRGIGVVWSY